MEQNPPGSVITIFVLGKEGFGVSANSFKFIDLWPWLMEQNPPGSVATILILDEDGFGIVADNFKILNAQTPDRNLPAKLAICHDSETQARNGGQFSPIWHYSAGDLSKWYAKFWLDLLAANMEGNANDLDYQLYIRELAERHQAREAIGAVVSANTRLSDRGRNHAPRQET